MKNIKKPLAKYITLIAFFLPLSALSQIDDQRGKVIRRKVQDEATGTPLVGVHVTILDITTFTVITDQNGEYHAEVTTFPVQIEIDVQGFEFFEAIITAPIGVDELLPL